ncbi:hypothetical protein K469DRAFT_754688 [Zopfia rhizophila CBS 207.26]|uniref:DUF659 domain-containing protein n=1 Tax=Zopfia rhizophila CBS 207.26 TaxID=1314779 RepID=A0A6A6DGV6_9PEZI|nr:hypothetical protein K469DRAFT_754688 [Zopfia rhizophila CBS 207.26]
MHKYEVNMVQEHGVNKTDEQFEYPGILLIRPNNPGSRLPAKLRYNRISKLVVADGICGNMSVLACRRHIGKLAVSGSIFQFGCRIGVRVVNIQYSGWIAKPFFTYSGYRSPPKKRARGQMTILVKEYKISDRNAAACDRLLAEAIYSLKVPFAFVENPAFVRVLNCLRPAHNPPSRYRIASPLLTETYKETNEKMEKVLEKASRQVTLVSDGWLNPHSEVIINCDTVT